MLRIFAGTDGSESPEISRAFELRFVTADPEADGETDFKGETEVFDLDQRIEYLRNRASYGRRFFKDPELNRPVVHDKEVESVLENLKPQPLSQIKRKIRLHGWPSGGTMTGPITFDWKPQKIMKTGYC